MFIKPFPAEPQFPVLAEYDMVGNEPKQTRCLKQRALLDAKILSQGEADRDNSICQLLLSHFTQGFCFNLKKNAALKVCNVNKHSQISSLRGLV